MTYRFRFQNPPAPTDSFLGTTAQSYTVTKSEAGVTEKMVGTCSTPPANIGPQTTPNYHALATGAVCDLGDGGKDFAGYAVHAIALRIPRSQVDPGGNHTIGLWAATDRQKITVAGQPKGKWVQVSRLGNPRTDLQAVLLTGVPGLNFTGPTLADELPNLTAFPWEPDPQSGADNTKGQQKP